MPRAGARADSSSNNPRGRLEADMSVPDAYYRIFGLKPMSGVTESSLKKKFRELSLRHHPDKGGSTEDFRTLKRAHEVLVDEKLKKKYDLFGFDLGGDDGEFSSQTWEQVKLGVIIHYAALAFFSVVLCWTWWTATLSAIICVGGASYGFFKLRSSKSPERELYAALCSSATIILVALGLGWWSGSNGWVRWLVESALPVLFLASDTPIGPPLVSIMFCSMVSWYCGGSFLSFLFVAFLLFALIVMFDLLLQEVIFEVLKECGQKVRSALPKQ